MTDIMQLVEYVELEFRRMELFINLCNVETATPLESPIWHKCWNRLSSPTWEKVFLILDLANEAM